MSLPQTFNAVVSFLQSGKDGKDLIIRRRTEVDRFLLTVCVINFNIIKGRGTETSVKLEVVLLI